MFSNCILRDQDGRDCPDRYRAECGRPDCKYYYRGTAIGNILGGLIWLIIGSVILTVMIICGALGVLFDFAKKVKNIC